MGGGVTGLLLMAWAALGSCNFVTDEQYLRRALFETYDSKVRPSSQVSVLVSFSLASLNELDTASQAMEVSGLMIVEWKDSRLRWTPADHGNISTLVVPFEDVWAPPLVVENAMEDIGTLGGKERDGTPIRFYNKGEMYWSPPLAVRVSCTMTIARFPFDSQECHLVVLGITYPLEEMDIDDGYIITELYTANGEFDLIATRTGHSEVVAKDVDGTNKIYRKLYFYFTFRRRWPFYGQNLVLPMVVMSVLMATVFALPIESGEKMSFSLTVLLSYVVFLTWVTDNLPPISADVSVIQVYLALDLCLGVLATMLTTWVLHLHHTPPTTPIPRFYRALATSPLLQPSRRRSRPGQERESKVSRNQVTPQDGLISVLPLGPAHHHDGHRGTAAFAAQPDRWTRAGQGRQSPPSQGGQNKHPSLPTSHAHEELLDDVTPEAELTWQELAVMFDRFFLWAFCVALSVSTTTILAILYASY